MKQGESPVGTNNEYFCQQVLISLRRIIRAVDLHSRMLLQEHGLTGPQLAVLQSLGNSGEVSVGDLAKRVHLSQGTLTGILDRLSSRGFVIRRRSDTDKRRMLADITPEADQVIRHAPSLLQEQFLRELANLADWEKSQTLSSLQRIVTMMEAESLDVAPMLATDVMDHSPDVPDAAVNRLDQSSRESAAEKRER